MAHERFERVQSIYEAALRLEPAARLAYLTEACKGDNELRSEVESLLLQQSRSEIWEIPALQMAADTLAKDPDPLLGRQMGPTRFFHSLAQVEWGWFIARMI